MGSLKVSRAIKSDCWRSSKKKYSRKQNTFENRPCYPVAMGKKN